jgi:hypothetical protein
LTTEVGARGVGAEGEAGAGVALAMAHWGAGWSARKVDEGVAGEGGWGEARVRQMRDFGTVVVVVVIAV